MSSNVAHTKHSEVVYELPTLCNSSGDGDGISTDHHNSGRLLINHSRLSHCVLSQQLSSFWISGRRIAPFVNQMVSANSLGKRQNFNAQYFSRSSLSSFVAQSDDIFDNCKASTGCVCVCVYVILKRPAAKRNQWK